MVITVDIGNTNIKYGIFKTGRLEAQFKQRTVNNATSDEIGLFICQYLQKYGFLEKDVEGIIISSVVPQIMFSFSHTVRKYFNKEPIIVGDNLKYDFSYISKNYMFSASDRLVSCFCADKKYPGMSKIVIDFGTATTFDVLNEEGKYMGGVIFPGLRILSDVLTEKTAQLPRVEIRYPKTLCGMDTINQMQGGIIYGYIGSVRNIIKELKEQIIKKSDKKVKVIATGGLVSVIDKETNLFDIIDKTLSLEGLNRLYIEHIKNEKGYIEVKNEKN